MKIIYYYGKDTSIFESLESLSLIKKSFHIKKINNVKINLNDEILILDDSCKDFLKVINYFSKKKKSNLIVTTKKENITLGAMQSYKIFLKPVKILEIYKEIYKKIKNNLNNLNLSIDHSGFSLIDKKGKKLKLTEKEFRLLEILLNNTDKELSKQNLLYYVWGLSLERVDSLNTRVLETLISRIRKKISFSKITIKIIKNKYGYILSK